MNEKVENSILRESFVSDDFEALNLICIKQILDSE